MNGSLKVGAVIPNRPSAATSQVGPDLRAGRQDSRAQPARPLVEPYPDHLPSFDPSVVSVQSVVK